MPAHSGSGRLRAAASLLAVTQFGHAHWFFGNLYEAVVNVPELLARQRSGSAASPFGRGSPTRYYALTAPAGIPALLAAVPAGWPARDCRSWLVLAATSSVTGGAVTAYLVRSVNLRLFFGDTPLTDVDRSRLLRTWYRLNAVKLVSAGGAWLAARRARALLTR